MATKRVVLLTLCLILALVILLPACAQPEPTPPGDRPQNINLTLLGFRAGTSMQLRADAIAEAIRAGYPDWQVASLAPGGEAQLLEKRIAGEMDYLVTPYPRLLELEVHVPLRPEIDFARVTEYSVVMPTSPHYIHFFALGKTGLTSIKDIVDKKYPFKVGTGAGGSKLLFTKILEYYGSSLEEAEAWGAKHEIVIVSTPAGVEALQAGRIDIGFTWSGIPNPPFMGATFDLELLPIDDPGLINMFKSLGYYETTIPAGTYPFLTEDVPAMAEMEFLAARPDLPDDIVYYTLKALFDNKHILFAAHADFEAQLEPEAIASSLAVIEEAGIPIHPGALKYYREQGWIE